MVRYYDYEDHPLWAVFQEFMRREEERERRLRRTNDEHDDITFQFTNASHQTS
jgi:hypothetical protein